MPCPLLKGYKRKESESDLSGECTRVFVVFVETYTTRAAYNRDARVTVVHDNVLQRPAPVPVDLDGCLGVVEVEAASCELLVAHVCTARRYNCQSRYAR